MEEVWKDISLSSLHHPTTASGRAFPGLNLQDFLACPSSADDPPGRGDSLEPSSTRATAFGCHAPPPATVLSLSSVSQFHYLESSDRTRSHPLLKSHDNDGTPSFVSSLSSPFEALATSTPVFPSFCKRMASENDDNSRDRRHKRMIKNRESAARSRARKQAYTNELENEVERLIKENAKLRRQLEKFSSAATSAQLSKKQTLHRTLTAPF